MKTILWILLGFCLAIDSKAETNTNGSVHQPTYQEIFGFLETDSDWTDVLYICDFLKTHDYRCNVTQQGTDILKNRTNKSESRQTSEDAPGKMLIVNVTGFWSEDNGIMKSSFVTVDYLDIVAKCMFKTTFYECFGVPKCESGPELSPCHGGEPWRGSYQGTPTTGFVGRITNQAMESAGVNMPEEKENSTTTTAPAIPPVSNNFTATSSVRSLESPVFNPPKENSTVAVTSENRVNSSAGGSPGVEVSGNAQVRPLSIVVNYPPQVAADVGQQTVFQASGISVPSNKSNSQGSWSVSIIRNANNRGGGVSVSGFASTNSKSSSSSNLLPFIRGYVVPMSIQQSPVTPPRQNQLTQDALPPPPPLVTITAEIATIPPAATATNSCPPGIVFSTIRCIISKFQSDMTTQFWSSFPQIRISTPVMTPFVQQMNPTSPHFPRFRLFNNFNFNSFQQARDDTDADDNEMNSWLRFDFKK